MIISLQDLHTSALGLTSGRGSSVWCWSPCHCLPRKERRGTISKSHKSYVTITAEMMSRYTNSQTEVVGADPKSYKAWTCCVLWSYKVTSSVVASKDTDQTKYFPRPRRLFRVAKGTPYGLCEPVYYAGLRPAAVPRFRTLDFSVVWLNPNRTDYFCSFRVNKALPTPAGIRPIPSTAMKKHSACHLCES